MSARAYGGVGVGVVGLGMGGWGVGVLRGGGGERLGGRRCTVRAHVSWPPGKCFVHAGGVICLTDTVISMHLWGSKWPGQGESIGKSQISILPPFQLAWG